MIEVIGMDVFPDLNDGFKCFKKPIKVDFEVSDKEQTIETLEGPVKAKKGDFIMTGVKGEKWPLDKKKFNSTYEKVTAVYVGDDLVSGRAVKNKIIVKAKKMKEPFLVKVSWSDNILKGKPGDFLVRYGDKDYGVVDSDVFAESYKKEN